MALLALTLGACVADAAPPTEIHVTPSVSTIDAVDITGLEVNGDDRGDDLCALATALPTENVCSLVCEPDLFAARLVADGMHRGSCYQFRCELSATTTVSVGVCLP